VRPLGAIIGALALAIASLAGQASTLVIQRSFTAPQVQVASGSAICEIQMSAGTRPVVFDATAGSWAPDRPVYVLVDGAYPLLGTTRSSAKGLYDHLHDTLGTAGWSQPVTEVNVQQAGEVLDRSSSILVVDAGAMPDILLGGPNVPRLTSFLNRGGELIYIGDGLLYWSSQRGEPRITGTSAGRLGWAGEQALLGANLVHSTSGPDAPSGLLAVTPSTSAAWLGISYQRAGRGALLASLDALGGWDLGVDSTEPPIRTSLAVVPVSLGRLVLFGSTLSSSETQVSNDIARVLLSGSDVAPLVAHLQQRVGHQDSAVIDLEPSPSGTSVPAAMRVLAYDREGFDYFSHTFRCSSGASRANSTSTASAPAGSPAGTPIQSPTGISSTGRRITPAPGGGPS
jgi:hypothetical protein